MGRRIKGLYYVVAALFLYFYFIPNAYLLPLTPVTASISVVLTIISAALIYRYPVLLRDPPKGLEKKPYSVQALLASWGILFLYWLLRDSFLKDRFPNIIDFQINIYYVAAIVIALSLPLLADGEWRQIPFRVLRVSILTLAASMGFYFYGNIIFDRTESFITTREKSYEHAYGAPDSKAIFQFERSERGKKVMMCLRHYPGAFGTPWFQGTPCPQNIHITEKPT